MNLQEYKKIENYMYEKMEKVDFSHGTEHVRRVLTNAINIAQHTDGNCDMDVLIAACLLHDIGRHEQDKNISLCHAEIGSKLAYQFLISIGWEKSKARHVSRAILTHRQRKNRKAETIEAKILYDADKLDSFGLIGIARMLMYGGMINEPLYVISEDGRIDTKPSAEELSNFFQEYSFKTKTVDELYTECAKDIARSKLTRANEMYEQMKEEIEQYSENVSVEQFLRFTNL